MTFKNIMMHYSLLICTYTHILCVQYIMILCSHHQAFYCDNCRPFSALWQTSSGHCWEFLALSLITQAIFLFKKFLTICLIPTNDYFIVGELSVNSWSLTKGGKSMCLGDSLSCRQSRRWTKLSCSYLCCELRDPSQVTLAWQTIHTNSPNHLFLWARWKVCFISLTRLAVVWLSKMLCCLDWLWCVQSEPATTDGRGEEG